MHENPDDKGNTFEHLAIQLGNFLKNYKPEGWKEPLGRVLSFSHFYFDGNEFRELEEGFRNGTLKEILSRKYKNPHIIRGISLFLQENSKQ